MTALRNSNCPKIVVIDESREYEEKIWKEDSALEMLRPKPVRPAHCEMIVQSTVNQRHDVPIVTSGCIGSEVEHESEVQDNEHARSNGQRSTACVPRLITGR